MEEFPIFPNIGGQNVSPYCGRRPLDHRIIFQVTLDAEVDVWELRYCGIVYHKDNNKFGKCILTGDKT